MVWVGRHTLRHGQEKPAQELLSWIERFSEHNHCAGWFSGIEFRLWRLATAGEPYASWMSETEAKHMADMLLEMAESAGGWWRWNQDLVSREFISLDSWKKVYEKWVFEKLSK